MPILHALTFVITIVISVQTLRNLINTSGQRVRRLFDQLDKRLKSADKKASRHDEGRDVVRRKRRDHSRHPIDKQPKSHEQSGEVKTDEGGHDVQEDHKEDIETLTTPPVV